MISKLKRYIQKRNKLIVNWKRRYKKFLNISFLKKIKKG